VKIKFACVFALIVMLSMRGSLVAQSDFYAIEHIPEVRLYFSQANWDEILDSLYVEGELARLGADLIIDANTYKDVGVRYKGFSSFSSERDKNPFNIDLDYVYQNQNHQGYKKIKLSNVIQDPSFVREVLSYEIARKYMPASLANYANVYVNDTLIGLYSNVEAVNGDFLEKHYGDSEDTFFKCNPETIDLNGENANLSDSPGESIDAYSPLYKLKSDEQEGWNELYEFIDILNNSPSDISSVLNIDQTLWMHAFNYALINFDSYIGYAQNYYLYKDQSGKFNPILWDLNMSFASYRLTDASDHWDGFSIAEAKEMDPLQHLNSFSVHPRPLIRNVLNNESHKRMYLAHLRTIMEENFDNQEYALRADYMQNLIDASVLADTNKFYSYDDFNANLNSTVSDLVDYPGITDLMNDRSVYLSSYTGISGAPDIGSIQVSPTSTKVGDNVSITATVSGSPLNVFCAYRFSEREDFELLTMFDDGNHDDGLSGDGQYGVKLEEISNLVQYYIYAENDSAGRFSPERAAYEFYEIESRVGKNELTINEIRTNNLFGETDQDDEYENWVELYNNSFYPISLEGMYLSTEENNLMQWPLPNEVIEAGQYKLIWLDGDTLQAGMHCSFSVRSDADSLWLVYGDGTVIDSVFFGAQEAITSFGRYPNATGSFREMIPSPRALNEGVNLPVLNDPVFVYPNPAYNELNIRLNTTETAEVTLYTLDGRTMLPTQEMEGQTTKQLDLSLCSNGVYLLRVSYDNENFIKKILITK